MSFTCGIVGLPNVGKSTVFNALSRAKAAAENFPFCTIDPNTGIVPVPDYRLKKIAEMEKSASAVPASIKFIDVAGLVEGASKGQGLGNQFLGHIRNVDAVAHVVRLFQEENVVHVSGEIDPVRDLKQILDELILADLELLEKHLQKSRKLIRSGDSAVKSELEFVSKLSGELSEGKVPPVNEKEMKTCKQMGMLSVLPAFVCANIDETGIKTFGEDGQSRKLVDYCKELAMEIIPVCGLLEEEISRLDDEEAKLFIEDLGINESALEKVIHAGYRMLDQITFFTTNPKETHAWTVKSDTVAIEAAGKVHTDMQKGFIRMEVVPFDVLDKYGNWNNAKSAGKLRTEGKEYILNDGDVVYIRFSV